MSVEQLQQRVHTAMQYAAMIRERFYTTSRSGDSPFGAVSVEPHPLSPQERVTYNAALDLLAYYFKCGTPDEPPAMPAEVRPPDPPEPPAAPGGQAPTFPRDPATPSNPTPAPAGGAS